MLKNNFPFNPQEKEKADNNKKTIFCFLSVFGLHKNITFTTFFYERYH